MITFATRSLIFFHVAGFWAVSIVLGQLGHSADGLVKRELATPLITKRTESPVRVEDDSATANAQSDNDARQQPRSRSRSSQNIRFYDDARQSMMLKVIALQIAASIALLVALVYYIFCLRRLQSQLENEKLQNEQQQKMRDSLEHRIQRLQRMESLGMLAGGIAHDFNNLLGGVIGNAELLKRWKAVEDSNFIDQRTEQILLAAGKAADLSRQMLTYAGKQNTLRKRNDLNAIAMEFSRVLQSGLSDIRRLEFELSEQPLLALTDRTQIEQILLNIVANAGRANGGNGQIIIRSGKETLTGSQIKSDPNLYGTRTRNGDFVFVEVEDSGNGISPEDLNHVFEPFFGKSETGRGLGLAVVYGLVSAHEGLIRIDSQLGIGTRLRVLIPESAPEESQPPTKSTTTAPNVSWHPASRQQFVKPILVIDDDRTILDWIKLTLEMEGYLVATTQSGNAIFDEFAIDDSNDEPIRLSRLEQFGCIILDVQMPDMTGAEVLAELQRRDVKIPVILMSGYSPTQLSQIREDSNVCDVLDKPFQIADLISAIKSAVDEQIEV